MTAIEIYLKKKTLIKRLIQAKDYQLALKPLGAWLMGELDICLGRQERHKDYFLVASG